MDASYVSSHHLDTVHAVLLLIWCQSVFIPTSHNQDYMNYKFKHVRGRSNDPVRVVKNLKRAEPVVNN